MLLSKQRQTVGRLDRTLATDAATASERGEKERIPTVGEKYNVWKRTESPLFLARVFVPTIVQTFLVLGVFFLQYRWMIRFCYFFFSGYDRKTNAILSSVDRAQYNMVHLEPRTFWSGQAPEWKRCETFRECFVAAVPRSATVVSRTQVRRAGHAKLVRCDGEFLRGPPRVREGGGHDRPSLPYPRYRNLPPFAEPWFFDGIFFNIICFLSWLFVHFDCCTHYFRYCYLILNFHLFSFLIIIFTFMPFFSIYTSVILLLLFVVVILFV